MISRGKTLAESDEQLRRSLDADSPAEQGPQQAPLFCQEAEPCLAVGSHTQVGFALMTVLDLQSAVPNRDSCLLFFFAGEGEVVDGLQIRRLPRLKGERQPSQETWDRPGPQTVADSFDGFERKAAGNVVLGVRSGNDVDRLHFLLQRTNRTPYKLSLVGEKWADDFFPSRADAQAISRLVVGSEGEALPRG